MISTETKEQGVPSITAPKASGEEGSSNRLVKKPGKCSAIVTVAGVLIEVLDACPWNP